MKLLVLGASGMAGHMVSLYFQERGWDVMGIARTRPGAIQIPFLTADLGTQDGLEAATRSGPYHAIINCAGILNQDATDHPPHAIFLNSYLPHWLVDRFQGVHTRILHLSTDCVFSGKTGSYTEAAFKDGDTLYDRSKALGEFNNGKDLVFRQSIIGPDLRSYGIGLLNWFLQQEGPIQGYTNAMWNGITTLELARGLEAALEQGLTGLYHLVAPSPISKHDLLGLCSRVFSHALPIVPVQLQETVDKTLVCTRSDFRYHPPPYESQLRDLRGWMERHAPLYPHYAPPLVR